MSVATSTLSTFPHKQHLILIAPHGSYRTMRYLQAAARLNLAVIIVSEGEHSIVSEYAQGLNVRFNQPQLALQTVIQETGQSEVVAVIGTDDSVIELASAVAQHFNLPHNDANAARLARRKDLARLALQVSEINIPAFQQIEINSILEPPSRQMDCLGNLQFPVVIKPLALSASRGVIRVNDEQQLISGLKRVKAILDRQSDLDEQEKQQVLLEEYIHGDEIAVEGIVENGKCKLLTIFDKPDPLHGPFFEETLYITPTRLSQSAIDDVTQMLQAASVAYGIKTGPVHAEYRISNNSVYLIEMAARTIGGLCSDILEYGLGCTLEEIVLKQSTGHSTVKQFSNTAAGVLMIPVPEKGILKRVEGLLEASKIEFIEDINIQLREGYELIPLPEGNSYLGFVFAKAPSFEQVEMALRKAQACLNVVVAPKWDLTRQAV